MCSGCNASELLAHKAGESRPRCDESRRGKYVTEYELAPCFEILQSCTQLGVKQGQTLGERFVALLGEGLQPPSLCLSAYSPEYVEGEFSEVQRSRAQVK